MLAELTLDLEQITSAGKIVAGIVLASIALWFNRDLFKNLLPAKATTNDSPPEPSLRSSDELPPEGFIEHLKIIQGAAPKGNPEVWWDYATKGLTEAQVAKAEALLVTTRPKVTP